MTSRIESIASLPERERRKFLSELTARQASDILYCWEWWARPNQLPPPGDWTTWLILAGRGFGKTRCGAEFVRASVCGKTPLAAGRHRRVALVAETAPDARDVLVEGEAGLLRCHPPDFRPTYEPSKRRLTWPNGAVATTYNAVEPDQLRGPEHDLAWGDEIAKWRYGQETWDMLQFGLRLGDHPRQVITTTPRPIKLIKDILADPTTASVRASTYENRTNLAPAFFDKIIRRYEGTRLGRQELRAEILDTVENALWTRDMLDACRDLNADLPPMQRVAVAVDPSGADGDTPEADDIGIMVGGVGIDGIGYLLEDLTLNASPATWGRVVASAYDRHGADRVVGEENYGGAMVQHVIQTARPSTPYKAVKASRGKVVRAEPIAALYEQGKIKHVGHFPALEDEFCDFTTTGYIGGSSPNRADAAIWLWTELFPGMTQEQRESKLPPPPPLRTGAGWMAA